MIGQKIYLNFCNQFMVRS